MSPVLIKEEVIDSRAAKFGKLVIERHFQMPNGRVYPIVCVSSADIVPVIILALTEHNTMFLVNQFRFGINSFLLELPGGCPKPGQSPRDAVKMELLEEAGVEATGIEILPDTMPFNPALEDNAAMAVIATGCRVTSRQSLDETEMAGVHEVTIPEFRAMVRSGLIKDCKTIAVTYRALEHLKLL